MATQQSAEGGNLTDRAAGQVQASPILEDLQKLRKTLVAALEEAKRTELLAHQVL